MRPEWEVFDALKAAGVDDGKALAAAKAIGDYSDKIAALDKEVGMYRWAVYANLGLLVAIFIKLFFPS